MATKKYQVPVKKRTNLTVLNPRNIPAGRHIIMHHVCAEDRGDDHLSCDEQRWYEGDAFDPPKGFGLERFLKHLSMPGGECEQHEGCAGPFLGEAING